MQFRIYPAAVLLATTALSSPVWAQSTPTNTLEEVVVTAQRRVENLQRVPIAITSISGGDLEAQGRVSVDSALTNVPAVTVQVAPPHGPQIYVRGVGSNGDSNYTDPSISLSVDGVYSGLSEQAVGSLFDVARVEVLRGPQGTLYGRNATGGAVNIITNDPHFDGFDGMVGAQVGNEGAWRVTGAVNLPLSSIAALRLAGVHDTHGTYYSNSNAGDFDQDGVRAKLLLKPSDKLSLLVSAEYMRKKGVTGTTVTNPHPATEGPPQFQWDSRADDPWYVDSFHPPQYDDSNFTSVFARLEYDMGWAVLTVIPSYSFSHRIQIGEVLQGTFPTGLPLDPATHTNEYKQDQYTGEVRISSPADSRITWVVGAYALWNNNAPPGVNLFGGDGVFADLAGTDRPVTSQAIFGQLTYPFSDALRVTAGLRQTWDKKTQDYHYVSLEIPGYDGGLHVMEQESDALTYKLGLEYDLREQSMLYAQVASGYKAGGLAATVPPRAYKPERLTAFEIGSKNRFLDGRLQVNAEAYLYKYKDMQTQTAIYNAYPVPPAYLPAGMQIPSFLGGRCAGIPPFCQLTLPYVNAGTSTIWGVDAEVTYLLTPNDEISFNIAYVNSELGRLVVPGQLFGFGGAPGASVPTYTDANGTLDITGEQAPFAPEWSGTISYQHRWQIAGGDLAFRVQSKISDGYWTTNTRTFYNSYQKSFTRSDAQLTFTSPQGWTVGGYVNNIEDDAQNVQTLPLYRRLITDPRTYGLNVGYKF